MLYQILAGLCAGIVSGMGVGGGLILIPILTVVLGFDQKIAQGITLLYFIPTASVALFVHAKNKNIDYKIAFILIIFGIITASIGATVVGSLSANLLKNVFAGFLILVGIYEFILGSKNN